MKLPLEKNLVFPHDIDSTPHLYYSSFFSWLYKKKLTLLLSFLDSGKPGRVLEVGCGAGVALKELSIKSVEVLAIDVHPHLENVKEMLRKEGITNVCLLGHDIFSAVINAGQGFDFIFTSSVLEHIPQSRLYSGIKNMHGALNADAYLLAGFPLKSSLMDALFSLYEKCLRKFKKDAYKFTLKDDHPSGQDEIIPAIEKYFTIEQEKFLFPVWPKLYICLKCKKRSPNES